MFIRGGNENKLNKVEYGSVSNHLYRDQDKSIWLICRLANHVISDCSIFVNNHKIIRKHFWSQQFISVYMFF